MKQILRNLLIAAGFYGIYYAVIQFIALFWRTAVVYDREFSGQIGKLMMWISTEIPFWLFCIVAGFCIPYVIESKRKYIWAIVCGCVFTVHSILFTNVYYSQTPELFDLTTRFVNMVASLILFPAGVYIHLKLNAGRPEQFNTAESQGGTRCQIEMSHCPVFC